VVRPVKVCTYMAEGLFVVVRECKCCKVDNDNMSVANMRAGCNQLATASSASGTHDCLAHNHSLHNNGTSIVAPTTVAITSIMLQLKWHLCTWPQLYMQQLANILVYQNCFNNNNICFNYITVTLYGCFSLVHVSVDYGSYMSLSGTLIKIRRGNAHDLLPNFLEHIP